MRQAVLRRRQAARQRLQVLQRVADVVLHRGVGRLVHQRQQARADVVVQILRQALALFVAAALHRLVVDDGAAQLLHHAVGQAGVLVREQALAALGKAQQQRGGDLIVAGRTRRHHQPSPAADDTRTPRHTWRGP